MRFTLFGRVLLGMSYALLFHGAALADERPGNLRIGWASADITPDEPVVITGQFHARVSEGIMDPVTVTALALESVANQAQAVLVSCDLIAISDELMQNVRERVRESLPDVNPMAVILHATHTHSGPEIWPDVALAETLGLNAPPGWGRWGIDLEAMPPPVYVEFAAERIADAVARAWAAREPGGISFGLGHAVVGHNRLMSYRDGSSRMYGNVNQPDFSHVEGYEDHGVGLIYTWNTAHELTGLVINVACPSQHDEGAFVISADFWHDTREALRGRLGDGLFVLAQCAAAGDQSEQVMLRRDAELRMERITGMNRRGQIAKRIAHTAVELLPYLREHVDWNPVLAHRVEMMPLSRRTLSDADNDEAVKEFERARAEYLRLREELAANPEARGEGRWYMPITRAYVGTLRAAVVQERYALQHTEPKVPIEVHVLRLGDVAIATNPFELYLDFGLRMQARSKAIQTFVVQLAGSGTYVPTQRAIAGGAYGSDPASNLLGPEGGQELVEQTLAIIEELWQDD